MDLLVRGHSQRSEVGRVCLPEGSQGVFHLPALLRLHHLGLQDGLTDRVGFGPGFTPGHRGVGVWGGGAVRSDAGLMTACRFLLSH